MGQSVLWKDDPGYPLNMAFLSQQLGPRPGLPNQFMTVDSTKTGVLIKQGAIIPLQSGSSWKAYQFTSDTDVTTLDTGVLTLGTNYYVYLCDNGTDTGLLLISANSTAPSGYTASNSRKIGGFHYGRVRNSITVADVTTGAVVPNSVWDLGFRPKCAPEGMVYIGAGLWMDIYLASLSQSCSFASGSGSPLVSGSAQSAYNAMPLTGTEGLSGYNFIELARMSGKRLPTLSEWLQAAHGSPQGDASDNNNAWSATTNSGRQSTGYVANAISLLNVVDCSGNVWEWLDAFSSDYSSLSWNWQNPMSGMNVGQLYLPNSSGLMQYLAGGAWSYGVYCGSRALGVSDWPWYVVPSVGGRFACDSL